MMKKISRARMERASGALGTRGPHHDAALVGIEQLEQRLTDLKNKRTVSVQEKQHESKRLLPNMIEARVLMCNIKATLAELEDRKAAILA